MSLKYLEQFSGILAIEAKIKSTLRLFPESNALCKAEYFFIVFFFFCLSALYEKFKDCNSVFDSSSTMMSYV